jgi:asparaginyl-tRNA synthetase
MAEKKFLSIKEAMAKAKGVVSVRGWVHRERGSNNLKFIVLRDTSDIIQCVIEKSVMGDEQFNIADKIQVETSMEITGTIKEEKRAPTGYELHVSSFRVVGPSHEFPITKDQSPEFLADKRHLWLRSRKMQAVLKIRSNVFKAIREYFYNKGFYEYHSPMFMSSQCEGGSTLFTCNYFGKPIFLCQTWQLHAEAGIFSVEKIFTIAPSFRAEKSKTSRHLTEYWHAEMEYAWSDFNGIMDHGEALIKHVFKKVFDENKEELKVLQRDLSKLKVVIEKPFKRMSYDDALKLLSDKCKIKIPWGKDLRTIEEDKLSELSDVPMIVYHYPKKVKAFYMKEAQDNPEVVQGCDFIATEKYGEIIGGSQREEDLDKIKKRLTEEGEDLAKYEFYLDTRRYGSVPHGGFGLGVERLITWICGLDNIKDSIAFPRTMLRYTP